MGYGGTLVTVAAPLVLSPTVFTVADWPGVAFIGESDPFEPLNRAGRRHPVPKGNDDDRAKRERQRRGQALAERRRKHGGHERSRLW